MEYKLILCGKSIYKEIELKEDTEAIKIGNHKGCKIRFGKEAFSVDFELIVQKVNGNWQILCSDLICVQAKNGTIGYGCIPQPGNQVMILNANTHEVLFRIDFFQDFPLKNKDYDLMIDFSDRKGFTIGGAGSDVILDSSEIGGEYVTVSNEQDSILLECSCCKTGIFVNGLPTTREYIRLRNKDFFAIKGFQFYLYDNILYTTKDGTVKTRLLYDVVTYERNHFHYPKFRRNVRQQYELPEEKIEVLDPDSAPQKPQRNFLLSIIPAFISLIIMLVLRSMMGRNGMFVIYSGVMMGMGIITSIVTYRMNGKDYREEMKQREERYRKYIEEQEAKIQDLRNREYTVSMERNPSIMKNISMVADFDARLFEKEKEHEDYLEIYLGKGVVKSACPVSYRKKEFLNTKDVFMEYPKAIAEKYDYIQDMPVTVSLKESCAIGFVGNRHSLHEISKNMIINLSVEHYYKDVKIFFVLEKEDIESFSWARWFQNTQEGDGLLRNFMYDSDSDKVTLEYLYSQLSERNALRESELEGLSDMIVFVYRSERIENHPIMQFVENARKLHFTFLFFEEYEELLHYACEKKVYLYDDENRGIIQDSDAGDKVQEFHYEVIPQHLAEMAAIKLACVYVEDVNLESSLTKSITLFELLGINHADELDFGSRWNQSKIYESMAAPLGVKSGGEIVNLDIHERFHGPHGLVAGTTGSGKSEILQSYILSLATLFHPYEVGFVIIDFKGGGMANQFKNLPHMLGAITNIDDGEINRSLKSIKAELLKRQEFFAECGVNHIDEYIKLTKQGKTKQPLPHLILIVDEFAELKAEQPDFMKELISTARVGRSLGVHLILATQKPSGVVNDQIWSNSKFKLCLKVQNASDSKEVIKSPLAAEIREPGRAYLQVGNNEIFQLFQSAYSGANAGPVIEQVKEYRISKVDLSGRRQVLYEKKVNKETDSSVTQLNQIVNAIQDFCKEQGIEKLENICRLPLNDKILYDMNEIVDKIDFSKEIICPIGIYDDPDHQNQELATVNLTSSNLFVVGSSQMGKTNFISTLMRTIIMNYSPKQVNVYMMDFGTGLLKIWENSNHVGGVALAREDEKIKNLLKILVMEIEKRKKCLAGLGISSYQAYLEAGYDEIPQILVFVESISMFREMYSNYYTGFLNVCREGNALGISIIATNILAHGIGMGFLNYFSNRIALYCNNSSDYSTLFERCRIKLNEIPGRGIIKIEKKVYETQMFLSFDAEKEIDRSRIMKEFITKQNEKYRDYEPAFCIPEIPETVTKDFLCSRYQTNKNKYALVVGMDYGTTKPVWFDLLKNNLVCISGNPKQGKTNLLKYIVSELISDDTYKAKAYIVDGLERKLHDFVQEKKIEDYCTDEAQTVQALQDIYFELEHRYQLLSAGKVNELDALPLLIFAVNHSDAYLYLASQKQYVDMMKNILTRYKNCKALIIFSAFDKNTTAGFGANEIIKLTREGKTTFMFSELSDQKYIEASLSVQKEHSKPLAQGDCFMVINKDIIRIKTVLS